MGLAEVLADREPWAVDVGDAMSLLQAMPADSVHCVITSPPYWGLRDYKTEPTVWGGAAECEHEWDEGEVQRRANGNPGYNSPKQQANRGSHGRDQPRGSAFCTRCSAWRGLLGMEPEPSLFVRNLGLIFAEVRRVLRPDGLLWVNMGDSYAGSWGNYGERDARRPPTEPRAREGQSFRRDRQYVGDVHHKRASGLKPKDLVGTPWRVAFGLQGFSMVSGLQLNEAADALREAREAGDWAMVEQVEGALRAWAEASAFLGAWWVRSDVIWYKPNVMPESVSDRPTKAHEYVFMLAKSERYFYDADAIKEPLSPTSIARMAQANFWNQHGGPKDYAAAGVSRHRSSRGALEGLARAVQAAEPERRSRLSANRDRAREAGGEHDNPWIVPPLLGSVSLSHHEGLPGIEQPKVYGSGNLTRKQRPGPADDPRHQSGNVPWEDDGTGRNKRTVWEIPTRAMGEEHFAAFPPALVEPMIKASTSEKGCCTECGAPWARVIAVVRAPRGDAFGQKEYPDEAAPQRDHYFDHGQSGKAYEQIVGRELIGWRPTCAHYDHLYRAMTRSRSPRRRAHQDAVDRLPKSKRAKLDAGKWWERARQRPGVDAWARVPALVVDIFCGSGTAGLVTRRLFRRFYGMDLNPAYVELSRRRIRDDAPLFNTGGTLQ